MYPTNLTSYVGRSTRMHWLFFLILFLSSANLFAQQQQRFWTWGRGNLATIEFPQNGPAFSPWTGNTVPNNLPNFGVEGTGVATDPATGTLLFYTDGNDVYDANHAQVLTGLGANASSAQPVALCVVPTCPFDNFYIFSNQSGAFGTVNQGPITYRTYNVATQTFSAQLALPAPYDTRQMAEGMIVIPNPTNPLQFWLVTEELSTNRHPVFRIDGTGITLQSVGVFGPNYTIPQGIGNMAYTPVSSGNPTVGEIAFIHSSQPRAVFTCQFNATTGQFVNQSNAVINNFSTITGVPYDVEWSPTGQYLYFSTYFRTEVYQVDMANNNTTRRVTTGSNNRGGGLKLGPDNQIYHITLGGPANSTPGASTVAVITTPDVPQNNANFNYNPSIFTFTNVFGYNFPEFITRPNWFAGVSTQGNDSLCPGETTTLLATVNAQGAVPTGYQWLNGGNPIPGATASSHTVTGPGSYAVQVTLDLGCTILSDEITIWPKDNCCFASGDPAFAQITSDVTYTSQTTWSDKVYVGEGVTVTVDDAILDISNVDVVFGACAEIEFINGAEIRANNSVFRPCNRLESWNGITFRDGVGTINECTFKNAWNALNFKATSFNVISDVNVTNNLFLNNHKGVASKSHIFGGSITGNTFVIDDAPIDYMVNLCNRKSDYLNDHTGIRGFMTTFRGNVSQNDFVNAAEPGNVKLFTGIALTESDGNFNYNNFTDMWRAIAMGEASNSNIENNRIEVSRHFGNEENQIRISESAGVRVTGNSLMQVRQSTTYSATRSGIYAENSSGLYIHRNTISGFTMGIHAQNLVGTSIGENEILDGGFYGIYVSEGTHLDVRCNQIHMAIDSDGPHYGIGYTRFQTTPDNMRIQGNCIFDTRNAIFVWANSPQPIPVIENNYLYNYVENGIVVAGFTGSIGSTATSFATAGRNTFVSNNTPAGAVDVFSTLPLTVAGNFGVSTVSANITVVGNNLYNSSAACGRQIGTVSQELTADEDCDLFFLASARLIGNGGAAQPSEAFLNRLAATAPAQRGDLVKGALAILSADKSAAELENFFDALVTREDLLSVEALLQTRHFLARLTGDAAQASTALAAFSPNTLAQTNWKRLAQWVLDLQSNNIDPELLPEADLAFLRHMQQGTGRYAEVARDYLHSTRGGHYYRFKAAQLFEVDDSELLTQLQEDFLEVYPNPVQDRLQVRYHVTDPVGLELEVVDVLGRTLQRLSPEANSTSLELDFSQLETGIYFLVLRKDEVRISTQKVVKH